jgi:hypothetical protein
MFCQALGRYKFKVIISAGESLMQDAKGRTIETIRVAQCLFKWSAISIFPLSLGQPQDNTRHNSFKSLT